jgi:hypothetical protein
VSSRVPNASQVAADELLVTFAPGTQTRVQQAMRSQSDMSLVGPQPGSHCTVPNDPDFRYQWYLDNVADGIVWATDHGSNAAEANSINPI